MKKAKAFVLNVLVITVMILPGMASIGLADHDVISPLDKGERGEQFL
ncbi:MULTISPECIES: hypothetical protein [Bhargavaea]|uniref:Uncharacterized protein n=1 Tax=Bhargavaea changchunensis TaxID=2134037 RepID=A0ABW2NJN3_9BACL|nr:hypothetical protein [Bhargavaea sp. CC-171006]